MAEEIKQAGPAKRSSFKATVALDGDTRRACNNENCSRDYQHDGLCDAGPSPEYRVRAEVLLNNFEAAARALQYEKSAEVRRETKEIRNNSRAELLSRLSQVEELQGQAAEKDKELLERTTQRNLAREARENWKQRAEAAEAEAERYKRALQKYGLHFFKCASLSAVNPGPCDCGFAVALTPEPASHTEEEKWNS